MARVEPTILPGCYVIHPQLHLDGRGAFLESYNQRDFEALTGLSPNFIQDNISISKQHVLRGLHYQKGKAAQAKWVRVLKGRVWDVVVDLRPDSPTFGKHFALELSDQNHLAVYIPKGMAHGFLSLEENTLFAYKCDAYYDPKAEAGIRFNDAHLGIDWRVPHSQVLLSEKDKELPAFKDVFS